MKKQIVWIVLIFATSIGNAQQTKKVCFLGNSYTYVNDLPGMVSSIATADGNTLIKDQNTPGGYTLEGHSTNSTSLSVISSDQWDYVVLQDQSQLPSFPWSQVSTDVLPYAEILCDSIRSANACAIPLFYNTWGRLNGDPQWDSINTFDKMNARLANAYGFMSDVNSGKRAPVGIGFDHVDNDLSSPITLTQLFSGDGSHPSVHGTYLAACIFYEMIFETSAQGNSYLPTGISVSEASYIQNVANHVVNDVDSIDIDFTQPMANFSYTTNGLEVTFINESEHSFEWQWAFSDGTNSTEQHPTHLFNQSSSYYATLTASYCANSSDTTIYINLPLGLTNETKVNFIVKPNPSNGQFEIVCSSTNEKAQLYSYDGKLIGYFDTNTLIQPILNGGIYLIKIGDEVEKLIIQD
ncbi:MAG: PKD domain-containing protein [Crocinitomicaceae bacterium]|nr:PKD domain-containing protein [Crocinitomicaceae bacterium]